MSSNKYQIFQRSRIFFQVFFLIIFLVLFFIPAVSGNLAEVFFRFDPLLLLMNLISSGIVLKVLLLSLIPLLLTLFLGRFFCGWICPLGTVNQFFSWLFRKNNKRNSKPEPEEFRLKYLIVPALIVSAFLGVYLWGWLDPFSLFSRSLAVLTPSADYLAQKSSLLSDAKSVLADYPRFTIFPYLTACLFFLFIGLNYYFRRFFCNKLCPLGALYGLTSRFGLLKFSTKDSCSSCGLCSKNCTYYGDPCENYLKSECMVCFNCAVDCPTDSVELKFKLLPPKRKQNFDLGRRRVLGAIACGVLAAPLIKTTVKGSGKRRTFIRPPGAVKENEFLDKCARCGQCVQSCPTGFIQPAFAEAGLEGIWTPVVNAKAGYCIYECKICTEVCPAEAVEKLSLEDKKVFKIGTAIINRDLCYTYADGFNCTVCFDKCPLKEKAIKFREIEIWSFTGRLTRVKQIYIDPDLCTGCGICEYVCPRKDKSGIYITPEDEQREKITGIL
ncbi:4Fe-4S dicluster domain-containing protein [candidate division KSB1 bacterium]